MEIKKRNRAELKSYFVKNAIPTETNFADLMDAVLIQKSDGVAKLAGDTLSIEAVGDDNSRKPALSFYRSFSQPAPSWRVELNPWGTVNDPASAAAGLSISDSAGASRLFVSGTNGNVGVGTVVPNLPLHVRGAGAIGLLESTTTESALRLQTSEGANNYVAVANRPGGRLALATGGSDSLSILRDGRVGIRTPTPERALHVAGTGEISLTLNANGVATDSRAGLFWHADDNYSIRRGPGAWTAPDYQQLFVTWSTGIVLAPGTGADNGYGRSFVEIRNGKGLRVSDGSVGIGPGTLNPAARLQVKGGAIMPEVGNSEAAGIMWPKDPGGGSGDSAFIRYSVEPNGEITTLRVGVGNDPDDSLRLFQSGADRLVIQNGQVTIDTAPHTGAGARALNAPGEIKAYGAGAGLRISDRAAPTTVEREWVMYSNNNRVNFWHHDGAGDVLAFDNTTLYAKRVNAENGLHFGGSVDAHIESDGALYRFQGQAYLTVDDNFYIRDQGGDIKFWFDTNNGVLRQDDWVAAPLQQGWVNYGSGYNDAAYYRDRQGMVHLRGLVRNGIIGGGSWIFILPAGFRPPSRQLHVVQTGDVLGRLDISADGKIIPTTVNPGWVSLDGISFRVV